MYLNESFSQPHLGRIPRRPLSRANLRSSSSNQASNIGEDVSQIQRPGSSMKNLFSRTMSSKASLATTSPPRPQPTRETSNPLSIAEEDSAAVSLLASGSPNIFPSTRDSSWSSIVRSSWDPPPLFQAYTQGLKHSFLDSPSASIESILRRGSRLQMNSVSGYATNSQLPEDGRVSNRRSKMQIRRPSGSIVSAWKHKLFILLANGHVLQYAAQGHHDRLPEKMLQLGPHSVAFASDAIPGCPYVLQISRTPDQDCEVNEAHPKHIWSRMGLRSHEEKRVAHSFLLVCESAEELDSWMLAVRREIEAHGGVQYRSETFPVEGDLTQPYSAIETDSSLGHNTDRYTDVSADRPRTSSTEADEYFAASNVPFVPLPEIKKLSGLWSDQKFLLRRRSSAGSSANTSTELDRLRGSSHSSTSAATMHRLSFNESHSSSSSTDEHFSETYRNLTGDKARGVPSSLQDNDFSRQGPANAFNCGQLLVNKPLPSPPVEHRLSGCNSEGRPLSTIPNFSLPNLAQRYSRYSMVLSDASSVVVSEVGALRGIEQAEVESSSRPRPTSTLAPLPSREDIIRKPRSRISSGDDSRRTSLSSLSHPSASTPADTVEPVKTKTPAKPAYTLFPKRYSSPEARGTWLVSPPPEIALPPPLPVGTYHRRSFSTPRMSEPLNLLQVPQARRMRRPASMQIKLNSSLEIEATQRSPAVSDMHFATNFGTTDPFNRSSSSCSSSSGSGSKLVREAPARSVAHVPKASPKPQEAVRSGRPTRKKASSSSSIVSAPPAGPPPNRPLPELPFPRIRGSSVPAGLATPRRIFLDLTSDDY